jgi:uncharacterized membrane protein YczE
MKPKQIIQHALGFIVIALGVVMIISPKLGAAPLDAFCYFIYRITPLSLGTVAILVGTVATIVAYLLGSKKHIIISYIGLLVLGSFVDVWKYLFELIINQYMDILALRILLAVIGIIIVSFGVAMTITSGLSPLPYERILLILNRKIHHLGISKIIIESTFLVFAVILGIWTGLIFEQINIFTVVLVFTIGPTINFFQKRIKKYQISKGENYEFELND